MPRTRLVWHLFAGWCGLVACGIAVFSWLATVELAELADASEYRRIHDIAQMVVDTAPPPTSEQPQLLAWYAAAKQAGTAATLQIDLLDFGGNPLVIPPSTSPRVAPPSVSIDAPAVISPPGDDAALAAIRGGAFEATSERYDTTAGHRILTLVMQAGDERVVRVTSDTSLSTQRLRVSQQALFLRLLAAAAVAILAGYVVSRRVASSVVQLADSASKLARGDLEIDLPTSDLAELSTIAATVEGLRNQLRERARTIGRQGSQQEAVLASMAEGVLAVDNRYRLLSINAAAATLLDIEPGKMLLRPLQEVVRNPDLRRFVLKAIDCQEPIEDDLLLRDGLSERTLLVRGTALRSPRGSDQGAVIVLNDVTHFRHLENIRRDFVANVSHELKTPTASIRGFVETLLDGAIDDREDTLRFLAIIARQAERLEAIIEDLLALSRIERIEESSDLQLETISLAEVIAAAIGSCQLRASERSISVSVHGEPQLTTAVNPPLLEQALINLIDNAIKYSDEGKTVAVRVERAASDKHPITISVTDEGCGIDPQHQPRLFERFYRVDRSRSRTLGGTGLGLSIVKHIVQAHGGTVDVSSTPGVGSTFSIHLPTTP